MDEHELHDSFISAPLLYRYFPLLLLSKEVRHYFTWLLSYSFGLPCVQFLAVDGPYSDKARAIYKELRSNLIRYIIYT